MQINVRFFAHQRDVVGSPELTLEVDAAATVASVWAELSATYPGLAPLTRSLLYAVNQVYADPNTLLQDGDEVAFIPPVSGGSGFAPFALSTAPLDGAALQMYVATPADGAVVLFQGIVRDNFAGRATDHLIYEAYSGMVEPMLAQIAAEAGERWQLGRIAVHHRLGRLQIGETAVIVAVAAPHRRAAFAAAEYIMDRIKAIVPIWKREQWADGNAEWVGHEDDRPRVPPATAEEAP